MHGSRGCAASVSRPRDGDARRKTLRFAPAATRTFRFQFANGHPRPCRQGSKKIDPRPWLVWLGRTHLFQSATAPLLRVGDLTLVAFLRFCIFHLMVVLAVVTRGTEIRARTMIAPVARNNQVAQRSAKDRWPRDSAHDTGLLHPSRDETTDTSGTETPVSGPNATLKVTRKSMMTVRSELGLPVYRVVRRNTSFAAGPCEEIF